MALLGLDELKNLQELKQLSEMENLQKLDKLDQLQHLDKLSNLQALSKLQSLSAMNNMHYLDKLQHIDNLRQLHLLSQLEKMQELSRLNNLQYMENLRQLNHLQSLQQLEVMNQLNVLNKLLSFNFNTLLYLFSIFIPGLVFQETITLLAPTQLGWKRAFVVMTVYNILNLLLCAAFGFHFLEHFLDQQPIYYTGWFCILLLLPVLAGGLVALLSRVPRFSQLSAYLTGMRLQAANTWDRFLTEAENYRIVITLNNEEKLMGVFHREEAVPQIDDPMGMYFTETSHYDPQFREWKELQQPTHIWVKGSEIKIVELSTQA